MIEEIKELIPDEASVRALVDWFFTELRPKYHQAQPAASVLDEFAVNNGDFGEEFAAPEVTPVRKVSNIGAHQGP
jgi:hypothetical protein